MVVFEEENSDRSNPAEKHDSNSPFLEAANWRLGVDALLELPKAACRLVVILLLLLVERERPVAAARLYAFRESKSVVLCLVHCGFRRKLFF